MTEFYLPINSRGFEFCHPFAKDDFETLNVLIDGNTRAAAWRPISMRLVQEDRGTQLAESDAPWFGRHALIFRQRVVVRLRSLLEAAGELLPLSCPAAELFVYNPTIVVDGLDEDQSVLSRFSSGAIMLVKRYALKREAVSGLNIFKLSNLRISPTFVSRRVVDAWNSGGFRGLEFEKV